MRTSMRMRMRMRMITVDIKVICARTWGWYNLANPTYALKLDIQRHG
jgi:hypothetical protein